jgi:hypothetical protein
MYLNVHFQGIFRQEFKSGNQRFGHISTKKIP